MKKIYYLSSCNTCTKIIRQLSLSTDFEFQDIKANKISAEQLLEMKKLSGSYKNLFSKRAKRYHEMKLKNENLTEFDYRRLILEEYTFLKRPVIIIDNQIFIGSQKDTIDVVEQLLKRLN